MIDPDDFGADDPAPGGDVIPFPNVRANSKLSRRWLDEIADANKALHSSYRLRSPLDALDELERKRKLPILAWPSKWPELAKRCRLYAGECMAVIGPTGGGKTSFAIEVARAAAGDGTPVLWTPLELDDVQINLRVVANMTGIHYARIHDEWHRDQIGRQLAAISDLWRYVDKLSDPAAQINALRVAIRLAKKIYGRPPLGVVDYMGKLSAMSKDPRLATRAHAEELRQVAEEEECYLLLLAQPSRANNATLTGKNDLEAASDAIAVAAEASEIEHACSVQIALNVFKADDAIALDAHALVTKARGTGLEGRQGMRFSKPGGVWSELGYLPATPTDVRAEVARAKKDKSRVVELTPETARADVNVMRAEDAAGARRRYILEALTRHGLLGMSMLEIRKVRGAGRSHDVNRALQELERAGDVERLAGRQHWRIIPRAR